MFRVTRYCVQPYQWKGVRLVKGDAQQFYTREAALQAAGTAKKRLACVEVYEVTGWPVQDIWDRPVLISRAGD
jgi:hypothetical protein